MSFLFFLDTTGLWIGVLLFISSLLLLITLIRGLIKVIKQAHILDVPVLEQQEIQFSEAGQVVLCEQGPLFSTRFLNLKYELIGWDEAPVAGRRTLFPAQTTGVSWVRTEIRRYNIPMPGSYALRIVGLKVGDTVDSKHRIVFMMPHLARSIIYVIGMILSTGLLIGSIVLFAHYLSEGGGGT